MLGADFHIHLPVYKIFLIPFMYLIRILLSHMFFFSIRIQRICPGSSVFNILLDWSLRYLEGTHIPICEWVAYIVVSDKNIYI